MDTKTLILAIFASAGFWKLIEVIVVHFLTKPKITPESRLLRGIGQYLIIWYAHNLIQKGWVAKDEYETLHDELFVPYEAMGGNGPAKRIMEEVEKLPIK